MWQVEFVMEKPPVESERLNVTRLTLVFVVSVTIPLLIDLGVDALFPSSISMLMLAGIVSIPIVAFTVSRAVLAEMERVIQAVAPDDAPESETGGESAASSQLRPQAQDSH